MTLAVIILIKTSGVNPDIPLRRDHQPIGEKFCEFFGLINQFLKNVAFQIPELLCICLEANMKFEIKT